MNELFRTAISPIENGVKTRYTEIIVKPDCLSEVPEILQRRSLGRYAIVTDSTVARFYGANLQQGFRDIGLDVELVEFPEGEQNKNLRTVKRLKNQLKDSGYEREFVIVTLGGGVVGDVGGRIAYEMGIEYVQTPTTLLAHIDSNLGGKVGVNTLGGKNLSRKFHHPVISLIDPKTALTLSDREYRSGLAEGAKYGTIDPHFGKTLEQDLDGLLQRDIDLLAKFTLSSLIIKAFYVDKDPFDRGVRQVLNFGHTIGHGIEFATDYRLSHGEAIAIGMIYEGRIAVSRGKWTERELNALNTLLRRMGLRMELPDYLDLQRMMNAIRQDKKREDEYIKLVVPSHSNPLVPEKIKITEDELKLALSK